LETYKDQLNHLKKYGITTIVSCLEPGFIHTDVKTHIGHLGMHHIVINWPNYSFNIDVKSVDKQAKDLADQIRAGTTRAAVHCWGGVGRTGSFIAMVMAHLSLMTDGPSGLVNHLRTIGPPDSIDSADQYNGLVQYLEKLDRTGARRVVYLDLLHGNPIQRMRHMKAYRAMWSISAKAEPGKWFIYMHNNVDVLQVDADVPGAGIRRVDAGVLCAAIRGCDLENGLFYFDFDNVLHPHTEELVELLNTIPEDRKFVLTARSGEKRINDLLTKLAADGYTGFPENQIIPAGYSKEDALLAEHERTNCRCPGCPPMYFFDDNVYNATAVYGAAAGSDAYDNKPNPEYKSRLTVFWVDLFRQHQVHPGATPEDYGSDFPFQSYNGGRTLVWNDALDEAIRLRILTVPEKANRHMFYYPRR